MADPAPDRASTADSSASYATATGSKGSGESGRRATFALAGGQPGQTAPSGQPTNGPSEKQPLLGGRVFASPMAYGVKPVERAHEGLQGLGPAASGTGATAAIDDKDIQEETNENVQVEEAEERERRLSFLRRNTYYDPTRAAFFADRQDNSSLHTRTNSGASEDPSVSGSAWWNGYTGRISTPQLGPDDSDGDGPPRSLSQIWIDHKAESASLFVSTINLAKTLIGAGWLSLPYLVSQFGLIASFVLVLLWAFMTTFTARLLCNSARLLPPATIPSWTAVCFITYPWLADVVDLVVLIACFGTAASFFVGLGDFGPKFVVGIGLVAPDQPSFLLERWFWATSTLLLIAPLSFLKNLRSLKFTSTLGTFAAFYLLLFVSIYYFFLQPAESRVPLSELRWWPPLYSPKLLSALPILTFLYACHQNIFTVFSELRNNTPRRMDTVIFRSVGIATIFYLATASICYATFGATTKGDVLLNYPNDKFTMSAIVTLAVLLLTSVPMQLHPARVSLIGLLERWRERMNGWFGAGRGYQTIEDAVADPYGESRSCWSSARVGDFFSLDRIELAECGLIRSSSRFYSSYISPRPRFSSLHAGRWPPM